MPFYLKQHSYGEFVFDHAWAEAYFRNGLDYYPKLVNAIPFTPCSGPRFAFESISQPQLIECLDVALPLECQRLGASGWHALFTEPKQNAVWNALDCDRRLACHFHWFNRDYANFEAFLDDCLPRKRKEIRRERRKVFAQGIMLRHVQGRDISEQDIRQFYRFYQLTNAKYNGHGGYLNEHFFQQLRQSMPEQMLLVFAEQAGQCIAGALNFFSSNTLYGRYWGCSAQREFLHFEVCFYQGIEYCIEHGLQAFDPGAQGEHKIKRGFRPILTESRHFLAHPQFRHAVQTFLAQEAKSVLAYQAETTTLLPFKPEHMP